MNTTRPFGTWSSPITPRMLASGLRIYDSQWDSDGNTLVWLEGRSDRGVLVSARRDSSDAPRDLTSDLSVRARVGYGGGDFCVAHGSVVFAEAASGRLFRQALSGGSAQPITPAFGYAAAPTCSPDGRWLLYVHSYERTDVIAIADMTGRIWPQIIASGHDFFMQPCWHPSGEWIAYVAWDHPNMPWDGTSLFVSHLQVGESVPVVTTTRVIAGGSDTAIFQPAFSPDGRFLAFVSDTSGFGQLFLLDLASGEQRQLTNESAEYGAPAWAQGMRTFAWTHDSSALIAVRNQQGVAQLVRIALDGGSITPLAALADYTWFEQPCVSPTDSTLAVQSASSIRPVRLLMLEHETVRVMKRTSGETLPADTFAPVQAVQWPSANAALVHGLLYLPNGFTPNSDNQQLPPAIVLIHGGPTSQNTATYDARAQFFTSRGYTVLDINYRGSTGYGRDYMLALRNNWGVCDVEDAQSGARWLAAQGYADADRLVIMGGSAGGFTVLETLCRAPGLFKAGLCLYGVSNMFALASDTHKFEERYLDTMLGPLPQAGSVYRERSPIFHAHLLSDAIAIFQGEDDQVVPRNQSDTIVASLRQRNIPHEYHIYAGEGHGWRKYETIERFFISVETFLLRYVIYG